MAKSKIEKAYFDNRGKEPAGIFGGKKKSMPAPKQTFNGKQKSQIKGLSKYSMKVAKKLKP